MPTSLEEMDKYLDREVGKSLSKAERWDFRNLAILSDLRLENPEATPEESAALTTELYGSRP